MERNQTKGYPMSTRKPQPPEATRNQGACKAPRPRSLGPARTSAALWPHLVAEQVHNLSQPLTALQGTVELALLSEHTAEGYRAALEQSWEQLTRLGDILSSLRDLADIHAQTTGPKGQVRRVSVSRGPFDDATLTVEVPMRVRPRKKAGSSVSVSTEERGTARQR